jgi:hypothetical protein
MKSTRILCVLLFFLSGNLSATTWYVTPTGAGMMNGTNWANAYAGSSLQAAITTAGIGDQVWVAAGTYTPTSGTDRTLFFSMKNGVQIYGSFIGTETTLMQRELHTNGPISVLSGEIGSAGNADNTYKIISNEQLDSSAIIDGFIIRDANDDRSPTNAGNGLGGGIYNHGPFQGGFCHPVYRNCVVTQNRASWGGGAFNNGYNGGNAEPTYINCVFDSNHATIEAGGMDSYGVAGNASPTLINCVFYENTAATNVGAMFAWGGNAGGNANPVLINCAFINNRALNGFCGAFIANNRDEDQLGSSGTSIVTLQNCIVWGNTATGLGPQFYILGNGAKVEATYSDIDLFEQTDPHVLSGATTGNINVIPEFYDMGAGADGKWMTLDDGLQLTSTSPCINNGSNAGVSWSYDLGQNERINKNTVDIGPYEYQNTNSLKEDEAADYFIVYPNPSEGVFILNVRADKKNTLYRITDIIGRVILDGTLGADQTTIDLTSVENGIYFLVAGGESVSLIRR